MPDHTRTRPKFTKHTLKFQCWACEGAWEQPDYYRRQHCPYCGASPSYMGDNPKAFTEPPQSIVNEPADRIAKTLARGPGGPGAEQRKGDTKDERTVADRRPAE